jgi:hypothetical protein
LKSYGIILLPIRGMSLTQKIDKTIEVLREHADELENAFTVLSENFVRIRKSF